MTELGWRWRASVLALLALTAAACGDGRGGGRVPKESAVVFSLSVDPEEKRAVLELLSRFQSRSEAKVDLRLLTRFRSQRGSRVDLVTSVGSAELIKRLREDRRRGEPSIHLFAQDNLALKPLVDADLVGDLSEVDIPDAVLSSMVPTPFDGRRLFLPFRPNVRVAYIDRQLLRDAGVDPPTDLAQLETVATKLKVLTGRAALTLSLAEGDPAAVTVSEWIVSFGGNPLVLNDEGSVGAFEHLQGLWRKGLLARESLFAKFDTEVDNLLSGRASLVQNWSFTSAVLAKDGLLGRFHVYAGWRGPSRAAHVIGGDVLGIPKGVVGPQRATAIELARFLMSKEAQELLVRRNSWPSIRADAHVKVPPEARDTFIAIREALQDGWFRPAVAYWPDVSAAINEAVTRALIQNQEVRPLLDELHGRIERAARDRGSPYP